MGFVYFQRSDLRQDFAWNNNLLDHDVSWIGGSHGSAPSVISDSDRLLRLLFIHVYILCRCSGIPIPCVPMNMHQNFVNIDKINTSYISLCFQTAFVHWFTKRGTGDSYYWETDDEPGLDGRHRKKKPKPAQKENSWKRLSVMWKTRVG